MEDSSKKIVDCVNDLVQINHDRTEGYETAAKETKDAELKSMFLRFSSQSAGFAGELSGIVTRFGGKPVEGTRADGKLYRVWMDVKHAMSGNDRKAVLSSCEYGEDVAKKNYEDALEKGDDLPSDVRETISKQHRQILQAHDEVKMMRDAEKTEKV